MIYGIGTDVCDIRRIRATLERRGERFAEKVLGPTEWQVYQYRKAKHTARGEAYLATRFSAKESFSKAIGLGIHTPMAWQACEILNEPSSGKPFVRLHGDLAQWFAKRQLHAHMTVSDETEYVATFCVVERLQSVPSAHVSAPETHHFPAG